MTNRSSAYTITYNGEIYNYIELKRELEGLGAQFGNAHGHRSNN
jgi:asparagine synthetase B (glutamine-hydrolysing)